MKTSRLATLVTTAALVVALGSGCTLMHVATSDSCSRSPLWKDLAISLGLEAVAVGLLVSGETEAAIYPAIGGGVWAATIYAGQDHYRKCRQRGR